MKNKISIISAGILLSASFAFAQVVTIGPRVGLNLSRFTEVEDASYKAGLAAGAFFIYSIQEHFGVGADFLYSSEGSKYNTRIGLRPTDAIVENNTSLNYLRIPVQLIYFTNAAGNDFRPKIFIGPSIGFLLSAKNEASGISNTSKDPYSGTDFGALIGIGLNYKLAERIWLNADIRYAQGFADVQENVLPGVEASKNQGASFLLGVGFGLGE